MHQLPSLLLGCRRFEHGPGYRCTVHAYARDMEASASHKAKLLACGYSPAGWLVSPPAQLPGLTEGSSTCIASIMRIVTIGIISEEDISCVAKSIPSRLEVCS